jgi:DNA-binding NtrC family response regulator
MRYSPAVATENDAPSDAVRTVPHEQGALDAVETSTFALSVIEGPDTGRRFDLDGREEAPRVLLGQSPACEMRLTDPGVSRRHAAFAVTGSRLRVIDLESTNGTLVNDLAITDAYLGGGERIRVGSTTISVARGNATTVALSPAPGFGRVVGESAVMRRIYPLCRRLAAAEVPVVIEGETGTGKEVLAESLHEMGPRAKGPFVVFDCTALPATLLEAALFGHERGAFTGAVDTKKGVFEQAHEGTLFIDEIGDLELGLQAKLLRALERGEVKRLGGDRWIKVNVRILAATRRDLDREVQQGRFRDDLFFRLAVTRIELPPLRERHGDVGALARHFWQRTCGGEPAFPAALVERLERHSWPGNVRELQNAVARYFALGELADMGALRPVSSTPPFAAEREASGAFERILLLDLPFVQARDRALDEFSRCYVERVLEQHGGNVTRAAAASGIARRYFQTIRAKSQPKP